MGFPDNPAGKESTAVQETLVCFLGQEDPLEKWGKLPTPVFLGIPGGSDGKESACNAGNLGSVPELERFPGGGQVFHSSILPGEFHELFHIVTKIQTQLIDFYDDDNMD